MQQLTVIFTIFSQFSLHISLSREYRQNLLSCVHSIIGGHVNGDVLPQSIRMIGGTPATVDELRGIVSTFLDNPCPGCTKFY